MNALDVISLENAKQWLQIEDDYDDANITRLIKSAVDWVENYTSYRLYQRQEVITTSTYENKFGQYPIVITSVTNSTGSDQTYKATVQPTKLKICCPLDSTITLLVGYDEVADIPGPLVDACYKIITYLYENRDIYSYQIPSDVQMLINQYRRVII